MKTVNKVTSIIDKVCLFIAAFLLVFICTVIALQVIVRKLGGTLVWVDEMTRYSFVWLVLFGTIDLARSGGHIAITSFLDMLPEKIRKIVDVLVYVLVTAFALVLTYAYIRTIGNYKGVTFSVLTSIPMGFHYILISVLMGLITLASVLHIVDILSTFGRKEEE